MCLLGSLTDVDASKELEVEIVEVVIVLQVATAGIVTVEGFGFGFAVFSELFSLLESSNVFLSASANLKSYPESCTLSKYFSEVSSSCYYSQLKFSSSFWLIQQQLLQQKNQWR